MLKMTYEIKYRVISARLARVAYPTSIYTSLLILYIKISKTNKNQKLRQLISHTENNGHFLTQLKTLECLNNP